MQRTLPPSPVRRINWRVFLFSTAVALFLVNNVLRSLTADYVIPETEFYPLAESQVEARSAEIDSPAPRIPSHKNSSIDVPIHARKVKKGALPVYWLNEKGRLTQRSTMERMFADLTRSGSPFSSEIDPIRIGIGGENDVPDWIHNGTLLLQNHVEVKRISRKHDKLDQYPLEVAAKLVANLRAVLQAYRDGHDMVLILNDESHLSPNFLRNWKAYARLAPDDWNVLQWTTNNVPTVQQGMILDDPWISWLPDLWSTHAYTIKRQGMKNILDRLHTVDVRGNDIWALKEDINRTITADEILFFLAERAYTSTYPWIHCETTREALDEIKLSKDTLPLPKLSIPQRSETLLVLMNIRMTTTKRMQLEVERIRQDVKAVCSIHSNSTCRWCINAVFTRQYLVDRFDEAVSDFPPNVEFRKQITELPFNKFSFIFNMTSELSNYDLVLVKDNDQRLAGFPWAAFVEKKRGAVIAAPLRQSPEEAFLHHTMIRQFYKFHDSKGWKERTKNKWTTELLIHAEPVKVYFLEMYFNLFDGDFAKWFFRELMIPKFINQTSAWGPDFLWCPAAQDYRPDDKPCVLVPLVSIHEDTRQIEKNENNFISEGFNAIESLRNSSTTMNKWFQRAEQYAKKVILSWPLVTIEHKCKRRLGSSTMDFDKCVRKVMGS